MRFLLFSSVLSVLCCDACGMEKRKVNFSEEERALLLDLVARHKAIIENKKTDAVSVERKRKEWEAIEREFNSQHSVHPRTWQQLKKCWENLKEKWRRGKADDTREIFLTGKSCAVVSPAPMFFLSFFFFA